MTDMRDQSRMAMVLLQNTRLSLDEITFLTGEDSGRIARYLLGAEPIPNWLVVLALLWNEDPDFIERSRDLAHLSLQRTNLRKLN